MLLGRKSESKRHGAGAHFNIKRSRAFGHTAQVGCHLTLALIKFLFKMSPGEIYSLHIIHILSILLLIGTTFYSFAGAPDTKKRIAIFSGVAALLILLTGIRMWQSQFSFALAGWIVIKLICWLGISAMSGLAYRRRNQVFLWLSLTCLFAIVAVIMAYVKPF